MIKAAFLRSKKALAAAAAVALLLVAAPAVAQVPQPYAGQLLALLRHADQLMNQYGYNRAAGPFSGELNARATARFPITLRAGGDYRIVGVCDTRCSDLDMRLYDQSGTLRGQDVDTDDVPVVQANPSVTGVYNVEVIMYQCRAAPCYYAFNVYTR